MLRFWTKGEDLLAEQTQSERKRGVKNDFGPENQNNGVLLAEMRKNVGATNPRWVW